MPNLQGGTEGVHTLTGSFSPSISLSLSLSTLQPNQAQSVSASGRGPPPKTVWKQKNPPKNSTLSGFEISALDSIPLRFLPSAFQCS